MESTSIEDLARQESISQTRYVLYILEASIDAYVVHDALQGDYTFTEGWCARAIPHTDAPGDVIGFIGYEVGPVRC